eukprot:5774588-Prymnesium_polylepis.1
MRRRSTGCGRCCCSHSCPRLRGRTLLTRWCALGAPMATRTRVGAARAARVRAAKLLATSTAAVMAAAAAAVMVAAAAA